MKSLASKIRARTARAYRLNRRVGVAWVPEMAYSARPWKLRPGNEIRLLRSGVEAFPAMLQAIAQAERSICLETYILRSDHTGQRFAEALCERARAGVAVRLIYDSMGSLGLSSSYLEQLERNGVGILEYHPVLPWRPRFGLLRRDHRKILVVDDAVAFTGGINIADEYGPAGQDKPGWYDQHCELRGPVVMDLARMFRRVWIRESGRLYPPPPPPQDTAAAGTSLARIIDNRKLRQRGHIRRAYLHAIHRAERSIDIMNAYFLPDAGIVRALKRALKRGVRVRILVPLESDVPIVGFAGEYLYESLLRRGVQLLGWSEAMMHAKSAVIDGVWATVGSYNLDSLSWLYNLEVVVESVDPAVAAELEAEFERAVSASFVHTLDVWQRRPWWRKLLSWLLYKFRRWL